MAKARRKIDVVTSRERAIQIVANHNCISRGMAERYTDSEIKEVLRQLRIQYKPSK